MSQDVGSSSNMVLMAEHEQMKGHGIEEHQFPGILVERATLEGGQLVLVGRCRAAKGSCPACQQGSTRVHSYRTRILHDLPCVGDSDV